MSTLERVRELSDEALAEWVETQERALALARYDWSLHARPEQLAPDGDWHVWLILAGRGWGKTRTGAEWIKSQALSHPGTRWAIVAATFRDARDTCVEGESGLLGIVPQDEIVYWNRSFGQLRLRNGSQVQCFGATEPDRLRGPQHHGAWCDELAAWPYPETWDQLQFGLRLGDSPRVVVTTTPKPTRLVRALSDRAVREPGEGDASVVVTRGSTFDNASNLAPAALEELRNRYEGTRLGRQELFAELLTDVEGALWTHTTIEENRVGSHPELARVVVAIDPAVTSGEDSDETGIVAVGLGIDGLAYVLADRSCNASPDSWARRAIALSEETDADRIVAEVNNGGDLVERVIRTVDPRASYRAVRASRGKQLRAEPVAALYEQGKVHHVGGFPELEDQMTTWTQDSGKSPDRLDALVWAITDLMLTSQRRGGMRYRTDAA